MTVFLAFFGLAAGAVTAAGYFALITSVGMINRAAASTGTTKSIFFYEECLLFGVVTGNCLSMFNISIDIGTAGIVMYGVFSGMFIGLLVVSLAETLKALPIFIRRVRIGSGLGIIILMIGLGKAAGHIIYYFLIRCTINLTYVGGGRMIRDVEKRNKNYNAYVEQVTPKASCLKNCIKAFITGGAICLFGQILIELFKNAGMAKDEASLWTTICLVLASNILTGLNIYPLITTWGGAGSLVPITGFANSVAAPAIEYKAEGEVFGIGCKIFTIAGPVILYGIFSSWIAGLLYLLAKLWM